MILTIINTSSNLSIWRHAMVLIFSILLINSCSAPSSNKSLKKADSSVAPTQKDEVVISAQSYISQAENVEGEQAVILLLKAAELYLVEGNSTKALWLSYQLDSLLKDETQRYQNLVLRAQALERLNKIALAAEQLKAAQDIQTENKLRHSQAYYKVLARTQKKRGFNIDAAEALMYDFAMGLPNTIETTKTLWEELSSLSTWQLDILNSRKPPFNKGWQQLLHYSHKHGGNPERLKRYLAQWKRLYPNHPAELVIDEINALAVELKENDNVTEHVAVLLPLSGKHKVAGTVLQQGVLAAYQNNQTHTLHFIDTQTLDITTLPDQLASLNVGYIIGPLLKRNVSDFLTLNIQTPTLLLNVPDGNELQPHQTALSMRPEDEASQAANTLSQYNYQYPMLMCHNDKSSKRLAQKFITEWEHQNGYKPEIIYFDDKTQMQKQLKESLDLGYSAQRYRDIRIRIKDTVKYEYRNRRDIDMIYIIGSSTQTKLLKPYIDVNVSPFASTIPVFSSSRSHSAQLDKHENRDLNGLTFTQMPWLLNSALQNKVLFKQSNDLWPDRTDSLQRFFAMGYDSLNLIDKIPYMQKHSYVRHYGQTGILKLNVNHTLTRTLLWGKYVNAKANAIELN